MDRDNTSWQSRRTLLAFMVSAVLCHCPRGHTSLCTASHRSTATFAQALGVPHLQVRGPPFPYRQKLFRQFWDAPDCHFVDTLPRSEVSADTRARPRATLCLGLTHLGARRHTRI